MNDFRICSSSGQLVPIKAFHIRAQLVNVTAEVVLYQVYHNTNSILIEVIYVFPFDENSSVCGFEVLINNIIIKCVVKEKEQTKREYREAIEKKSHGVYLMHQQHQLIVKELANGASGGGLITVFESNYRSR
ncbi:unnamed protein product [Rotaria sp. Silwood1]|nr:unnamed protein product [Rotaria sp. Silwood1]CAF4829574.1 unnamed protein product [Rotaria sp. Silwood1]